ncbi:MAG: pyruvate carboxyltransferase, partial [Bacillota bacterium]
KPLEAHFHNDFGCGAANTVLALAEGVEAAHTTISGIGERTGNAPFEDVVLMLLTMYGIDLGVKYEKIYETSKLVQEIAGIKLPPNREVVGDYVYKVESGVVVDWINNCLKDKPLEIFPYHWELVGQAPPEVMLGKCSGQSSVIRWLDRLGIEVRDSSTIEKILNAVKEKAYEVKRLLTEEEFKEIVKSAASR